MVYISVLSPSDVIIPPSSRYHIYLARLLPSVVLGREHTIVTTSSLVPEIRGVPTVTSLGVSEKSSYISIYSLISSNLNEVEEKRELITTHLPSL